MREFEHIANHGSAYANNYSAEQNAAFASTFSKITYGFREAQLAGLDASDDSVQDLVRQHFEFCSRFWTPDRSAYKALAQNYLLPTPYRDSYEAVGNGLAKFHHDAMVIWADANLD